MRPGRPAEVSREGYEAMPDSEGFPVSGPSNEPKASFGATHGQSSENVLGDAVREYLLACTSATHIVFKKLRSGEFKETFQYIGYKILANKKAALCVLVAFVALICLVAPRQRAEDGQWHGLTPTTPEWTHFLDSTLQKDPTISEDSWKHMYDQFYHETAQGSDGFSKDADVAYRAYERTVAAKAPKHSIYVAPDEPPPLQGDDKADADDEDGAAKQDGFDAKALLKRVRRAKEVLNSQPADEGTNSAEINGD